VKILVGGLKKTLPKSLTTLKPRAIGFAKDVAARVIQGK
jgi:hypothetical protein